MKEMLSVYELPFDPTRCSSSPHPFRTYSRVDETWKRNNGITTMFMRVDEDHYAPHNHLLVVLRSGTRNYL